MASFTRRYHDGEHEEVWAELVALGDAVRLEPLFSDAQDVARETMLRVRENAPMVIDHLMELGFVFGQGLFGDYTLETQEHLRQQFPLIGEPTPDSVTALTTFESAWGSLPLSLHAFYEVVGSVNLVGQFPSDLSIRFAREELRQRSTDPEWRPYITYGLDPLFVYPLSGMHTRFLSEYDGEDVSPRPGVTPIRFPVAPDSCIKYGESGGGEYTLDMPSLAADGRLRLERHDTTFVNYLRICFRWGGFPGLELAPSPRRPKISEMVSHLTQRLIPF